MAWTDRVLVVMYEHKYKDELKYRFEIVRPEDGNGKHYEAEFRKTCFFKSTKNPGEIVRISKGLQARDKKWFDEHSAEIDAALAAKYDAIGCTPKPAPDAGPDAVDEVPY